MEGSIAYQETLLSDNEALSSILVQMLAWYVPVSWRLMTVVFRKPSDQLQSLAGLYLQGRDHTIYALAEGHIKFKYSKLTKRRTISVETLQQQQQHQQVALKQVQLQLP